MSGEEAVGEDEEGRKGAPWLSNVCAFPGFCEAGLEELWALLGGHLLILAAEARCDPQGRAEGELGYTILASRSLCQQVA